MRRNHSSRDDAHHVAKPSTPVAGRGSDGAAAKPPSRDQSMARSISPNLEGDEASIYDKNQPRMVLKDQRSQSFRDGAGSALFSGLRYTTAKAAEGFGKAHTRLFKQSKPTAAPKKRPLEFSPNYEPKVINLPLIEQTRITRIARRLEYSKDKTEFWMPALPWRCIE